MHYQVKHGPRVFDFDGERIASSTSKTSESIRWVDFNLYVTAAGSYVLERIGQSDVFHKLGCEVAERNSLKFTPGDELEERHVACKECDPDEYNDVLVLEKPRYFGVWSEKPEDIIDALHRKKEGVKYMTLVTERLIEEASEYDKRLEKAFRIEYIR